MSQSTSGRRRSFLRSACVHCLGFGGLLQGGAALAQAPAATAVVPAESSYSASRFLRPASDTDEGGLWAMMDREETRLRRSPLLIRDEGLSAYLRDLTCRLVGDHCSDIRIHVVRTPLFNASMAPNGMMQIWSGLLLRVENEAQLAAVLGHELGHYLERHSVERLRDFKSRMAFAQFLGMFGAVGAIGQLGVLASVFAFSREHEMRADRMGMQLMKRAGYDGQQAARVWDNLLGELKITGGENAGKRSPMLATHPPAETRRDELLKLAGSDAGTIGELQLRKVVAPFRLSWLQDEVRRGQYEESLVLLDRLLARSADDAQLLYARAEVYRLRAEEGDLQRSLNDLVQATAVELPPAEVFRSLGLVHKQQANTDAATLAFERYLAVAPEAADASLIRNYITELKP